MHLLYITFGNDASLHAQAGFSIYSFLTQNKAAATITVMTDRPDYYAHLKEAVKIFLLDEATLTDWQGPHRFFWRIKIKAIQYLCAQYAGEPVMYLDTDTFLYGSGTLLAEQLKKGKALMHEEEGPLSKRNSKTEKLMWQQTRNRAFEKVAVTATTAMWNAGVVATPNTEEGKECTLALAICDQMCAAGVTKRLIEQLALSMSFAHVYSLQPADHMIAHYWSNKEEWNREICSFFSRSFFNELTRQQIIAAVSAFDFSSLPVKKLVKNTARRLHKRTDQLFKAKVVYVGVTREKEK